METNYPSDLPNIFRYDLFSNKLSFGNEKTHTIPLYTELFILEDQFSLKMAMTTQPP